MERLLGTIVIAGLPLMVVSCDGLHRSIYNLTPCPIQVTYSTGNVINNTVMVAPGKYAGSFGGMFARVDDISVKDSAGQNRTYTANDLALLRPSSAKEDHWLYLPTGLKFGLPQAGDVTSVEPSACSTQ